jgi:hypothetical protein
VAEVRTYFPAWRVFIFGVDVTEDITRCIINYTGSESRAPSTAEVTLVNGGTRGQLQGRDTESPQAPSFNTDRYIMTERDIATLYGIEDELPAIRFPDLKDVLQEVLTEDRSVDIDFGPQPVLPTLLEAAATLSPELLTGDPALDEPAIQQQLQTSGQTELEYRREALRQSIALNTARERTEARTQNILETRVAARSAQLDRIVRERIEASIEDPVKRRVLLAKFNVRQELANFQPNLVDPFNSQSIAGLQQLNGQVLRYPFHTGDSIFHSNDQVRIFWRDPTDAARWYHMFAGFVSDYSDVVDENDQRLVRIRFEDASRILRYARLTTNPGILDIEAAAVASDAITRTFFNDGFADLNLPQFLFTVIFGAERAGTTGETGTEDVRGVRTFANLRYSVNGQSESTLLEDAVGSYNFDRSFVAVFGPLDDGVTNTERDELVRANLPATTVDSLAQYQALVDHRVYVSDLTNMSLPEPDVQTEVETLRGDIRKRADGTFVTEDIVRVIGENPHLFPVDFGRLCFLVPGSLGPATNQKLLLNDIIGVNTQTTWRTRLSLIYDVVERLDFQFYCSPKGDLICEMPLYDFEPDDFGNESLNLEQFLGLGRGNIQFDVGTDRERGPFGPQLRVAKRDTISWERQFIDENVRTQMLGVWSLIPEFAGLPASETVGNFAPVNLYGLIPQFGVRSETIDPMGIISNENAARVYANVKLNQINAEAKKATVQVLPRVQLGFPNRPMEFSERTFVATTVSLTHDLTWGLNGSMTTSMDLKYVRAWGGQVVDGDRLVYEPIGGFASQALNYPLRFGQRSADIRASRDAGNTAPTANFEAEDDET